MENKLINVYFVFTSGSLRSLRITEGNYSTLSHRLLNKVGSEETCTNEDGLTVGGYERTQVLMEVETYNASDELLAKVVMNLSSIAYIEVLFSDIVTAEEQEETAEPSIDYNDLD